MKKLEIIIRPGMLEQVRNALSAAGVSGMNCAEIRGFGRQGGHTEVYRGQTVQVDFLPKAKIEVVVADDMCEKVVEAAVAAARTGHVGDGKIFVSDVLDAIRIRTGERGDAAV